MKICLRIQNSSEKPNSLLLTKTTVVGRASDCDLQLNSDLVSRYHCKIFLTGSVALINDLGSSNGTFINGDKLIPKRDTKLTPGCLLSVANINFKVEYDSREFVDVGSTVYLENVDQVSSGNPLASVSDTAATTRPAETTTSQKSPQQQPGNSGKTKEQSPEQDSADNIKTVQFPEIDLPDTIDKH